MAEPQRQLVLMPYASLGTADRITWGGITVTPWEVLRNGIAHEPLRAQIDRLLAMYWTSSSAAFGRPQRGIGVIQLPGQVFRPLSEAEERRVREFQAALFLASLAKRLHHSGPNAGHGIATAENFQLVYQNFVVGVDRVTERSGVLVALSEIGHKIDSTRFVRPPYVPTPSTFECDQVLLSELERMGRGQVRQMRRIIRSAAVFLESYHNSPAVDVNARVLLQAAAFEILWDLPSSQQRKELKERVEEACGAAGERRFRYSYETPRGRRSEVRTVFGIWADRFYTLRNHVVHGEVVRPREYTFRGGQHHVLAASHVYAACVRYLVNRAAVARGGNARLHDRVYWYRPEEDTADDDEVAGFRTEIDLARAFGYISKVMVESPSARQ